MSFFSRIVRDAQGPLGVTSRSPAGPGADTAIGDVVGPAAMTLGAATRAGDEPAAAAASMTGARVLRAPHALHAPAAGEVAPAVSDAAGVYERTQVAGEHRLAVSEGRTVGDQAYAHATDPDAQRVPWQRTPAPLPGSARLDAKQEIPSPRDEVVSASEPAGPQRSRVAPQPGGEPARDERTGAVDGPARVAASHSAHSALPSRAHPASRQLRDHPAGRARSAEITGGVARHPAAAAELDASQPASTHGTAARAPSEEGTHARVRSDAGAPSAERSEIAPAMPMKAEPSRHSSRAPASGDERNARDVRQRPPAGPTPSATTIERAVAPGSREVSREPRPGAHVHIGHIDIVVVAPEPARPASTPASTNLVNRLYLRSL